MTLHISRDFMPFRLSLTFTPFLWEFFFFFLPRSRLHLSRSPLAFPILQCNYILLLSLHARQPILPFKGFDAAARSKCFSLFGLITFLG